MLVWIVARGVPLSARKGVTQRWWSDEAGAVSDGESGRASAGRSRPARAGRRPAGQLIEAIRVDDLPRARAAEGSTARGPRLGLQAASAGHEGVAVRVAPGGWAGRTSTSWTALAGAVEVEVEAGVEEVLVVGA